MGQLVKILVICQLRENGKEMEEPREHNGGDLPKMEAVKKNPSRHISSDRTKVLDGSNSQPQD
jgi:hypothetical protein